MKPERRLVKCDGFPSRYCWKHRFTLPHPDKRFRWYVGKQYSGLFYNHPYWAFLQKKHWLFGWVDYKRVVGQFYEDWNNPQEDFKAKVAKALEEVWEK